MAHRRQAEFRFYEGLNDFLPTRQRKQTFFYAFSGTPSIKDAIEAIGVPHPEVDLVVVDGVSVDFGYRLQGGERIAVYPVFEALDIDPVVRLRPAALREIRFVLDVHLGRLARRLRLLGFDALYVPGAEDAFIIRTAATERRAILTRDRELLKNGSVTHGYWVRSTDVREQVVEVVRRFDLRAKIQAFARCTSCNGLIKEVAKDTVQGQVPPRSAEAYEQFFQCACCGKVYWKGSHFERLSRYVEELQEGA